MSVWGNFPPLGAAARRPLPEVDPVIEALCPADRAVLAHLWAERAENELGAGAVFAVVSQGLFAEGVDHEILWLASRAVCDELRHAEICRYLAFRYGGSLPARAVPPPVHVASDKPHVHAVLNGAIHETVGSAFLSACHAEAESALARAALRELLADEMDHARIGWALLGSGRLPAEARREVERLLPALVRMTRRSWSRRAAALPGSLPRGHGCLPGPDVMRVVEHALKELVLPGFAHVGVDPSAARASLR